MNDKITQNMTYTAMRSKLYAEHAHHKNDSSFKPEAKLRFNTVKGLRTRRWSVPFRKTKTKVHERRQAIDVVKNAINKEFGGRKVHNLPVGDFIMKTMGKDAASSYLTLNDLKEIDGFLMERNVNIGHKNYNDDGGHTLRIAENAEKMFQSAIDDPYSRASDDLKHWKTRSVGAERMHSAVMRDLKELDPKKYGTMDEDELCNKAEKVMSDAGVNTRRGISSKNIERLNNFMVREYGETGSGLGGLSNTLLMRKTVDHAKNSMNLRMQLLKDDIQAPSTPGNLKESLRDLHGHANRLKSDLILLNSYSHAPGSDDTVDLQSGYRDLANKAQSLRNSLPKDVQDGREKTLQLYKNHNADAGNIRSFDELPDNVQVNAMKHIKASLNTAKNLNSLANESHNLALALLPPKARVPGGHGSFFSDNSLRNPTDLGNAKPGDIGQKVVLPKGIYQKATDIEHDTYTNPETGEEYQGIKKRSRLQRFFDKRRAQNPSDFVNQSAITERNLTNVTKLYNGMVDKTQKSLAEYQKDPKSLEKLEAFIEDAEYTSILGNHLMSKTKTLAGQGRREPASFLQKLHSFFRPRKYLQNGKIRFNNKNQLADDLQPTMRSLGEQRESLNNLRRMAAIEYERLRPKAPEIDAQVRLQDPITEQDKYLTEVLLGMKTLSGFDNVEMPPKNEELPEERQFDSDSEVSTLPAKDSEPKERQPEKPVSRQSAPLESAPLETAQPLRANDLEPKSPGLKPSDVQLDDLDPIKDSKVYADQLKAQLPRRSVPPREIHHDAAVKNVADKPVAENPEPSEAKDEPAKSSNPKWTQYDVDWKNIPVDPTLVEPEQPEAKKKPAKLQEYWVDVSGDEPEVHQKKPDFPPVPTYTSTKQTQRKNSLWRKDGQNTIIKPLMIKSNPFLSVRPRTTRSFTTMYGS